MWDIGRVQESANYGRRASSPTKETSKQNCWVTGRSHQAYNLAHEHVFFATPSIILQLALTSVNCASNQALLVIPLTVIADRLAELQYDFILWFSWKKKIVQGDFVVSFFLFFF